MISETLATKIIHQLCSFQNTEQELRQEQAQPNTDDVIESKT